MAYRFKELIKDVQSNVWADWRDQFKKYVPIFIKECQSGSNWAEWPDDSLYKFLSSDLDNPVSDIKLPQGKFTDSEIDDIKKNWNNIIIILKSIASNQKELQTQSYENLEREIGKYTSLNRWSAIHRMVAGIQPEILTTVVNHGKLEQLCGNLMSLTDIKEQLTGSYYEKSSKLMKLIKEHTPGLTCYDIPTFAWQIHVILEDAQNEYKKKMETNKEIIEILKDSGQIILTGAPGTGKTYKTAELALILCDSPEDTFRNRECIMREYNSLVMMERVFFTTFHQSMDYEDFVEGYKPIWDEDAKLMKYELRPGIFSLACKAASQSPDKNFVLIIDEINRGNISKILGELITLLEYDKREGKLNMLSSKLTYSKLEFSVPKNLYIIGTMNSTDRSTGTIDYALRRRFQFITLFADENILDTISDDYIREEAKNRFESAECYLKDESTESDFKDLMVGHSYFLAETLEQLDRKWTYGVLPLLDEYYKDGLTKSSFDEWTNKRNQL